MWWGKVTLLVFRFEKLFSPSPSANAVDDSSSKVTFKPSIPQIEQNRSRFELLSYQVFAVALADSSSIRNVPPGSQNFASRWVKSPFWENKNATQIVTASTWYLTHTPHTVLNFSVKIPKSCVFWWQKFSFGIFGFKLKTIPMWTKDKYDVSAGENAEDLGGSDVGRGDGDGWEHGRDYHAREQQTWPGSWYL